MSQTNLFYVPLHAQAAKAQAESASTQKAEREVTRMVVVMVLGFLVCWMPYASFALWLVNNRGQTFDLRMATIPSCFSKASTVYNPMIYILLNKQVGSLRVITAALTDICRQEGNFEFTRLKCEVLLNLNLKKDLNKYLMTTICHILSSAKVVMFLPSFVCLFFSKITPKVLNIF